MSNLISNKSLTFGVIGAYNSRYSKEVIGSLRAIVCNHEELEIIWVVTTEITEELDVTNIRLIKKWGFSASEARNYVIENTQSNYLVLMDSDMRLIPSRIQGFINFLFEHGLVTARYDDHYLNTGKRRSVYSGANKLKYCGGFIAFRTDLVDGLRFDIDMNRMQDVLFSYKICRSSPIKSIEVYPFHLYDHMTIGYNERERYDRLTIESFYKYRGILISKVPLFILQDRSSLIRMFILLLFTLDWQYALASYIIFLLYSFIRLNHLYEFARPILIDYGFLRGLIQGISWRFKGWYNR
jgi:glycosyltransferase involved in cell wall biosynthesis